MEIQIAPNGDNYVHLYDMYEWTIGKLERNEFDLGAQKQALDAIKSLNYLKKIMDEKIIAKGMLTELTKGVNSYTVPCDIYAISYIHYRCKQYGFDCSALQLAVDTHSEYIAKTYLENCNKS